MASCLDFLRAGLVDDTFWSLWLHCTALILNKQCNRSQLIPFSTNIIAVHWYNDVEWRLEQWLGLIRSHMVCLNPFAAGDHSSERSVIITELYLVLSILNDLTLRIKPYCSKNTQHQRSLFDCHFPCNSLLPTMTTKGFWDTLVIVTSDQSLLNAKVLII